MSTLDTLQFDGNSLSGDSDSVLQEVSNYFSYTVKLAGPFPSPAQLPSGLKSFNTRGNQFTGHVYPSWTSLSILEYLNMANNELSGEFLTLN